jgi:hypothetical protein
MPARLARALLIPLAFALALAVDMAPAGAEEKRLERNVTVSASGDRVTYL